MKNTYRFGYDCLGNIPNAVTVEGVCFGDLYREPRDRYYNQTTGERGCVYTGDDGELHFCASTLDGVRGGARC